MSPFQGRRQRGVGNQDSPRRGKGSVNLTKIFAQGGFPPEQIASPFEGGLGGSAPLLVRFLGASEKMNGIWGLGVSPSKQKKGESPFSKAFSQFLRNGSSLYLDLPPHHLPASPGHHHSGHHRHLWCRHSATHPGSAQSRQSGYPSHHSAAQSHRH